MRRRSRCSLGRRLRQRVTLQEPTMPTDGTVEPSFSDSETVWAEVLPKRGKESTQDRQVQGIVTWEVTMRNPVASVDPTWRITWGSRTLNIVSAYDPDQLGQVLVCECQEAQP